MCAPCTLPVMAHLSDYMAEHGLSDDQVAEGIERSRPTVSRIRRRLVRPDWDTIEKIKNFTNGAVTANDFIDMPTSNPSEAA